VQDEGLVLVHLNEPGQVILLLTGVNERVLVVIKKPEESVQSNIHAGWLNKIHVQWVEADPARLDGCSDIAV
jgi:hypothetical protein